MPEINTAAGIPPQVRSTLLDLPTIDLSAANAALLDKCMKLAGGDASWRMRKRAEASDLLRLQQIAPQRIRLEYLDMQTDLQAEFSMNVPVPCLPDGDHDLRVISGAVLGLTYRRETMFLPQPGYSLIQVLAPSRVWHANVAPVQQSLCLGAKLPAGILVKELVLMAYGALSMQIVQFDVLDSAGVMNPVAAHWWQSNLHRIPLSKEPFVLPEPPRRQLPPS